MHSTTSYRLRASVSRTAAVGLLLTTLISTHAVASASWQDSGPSDKPSASPRTRSTPRPSSSDASPFGLEEPPALLRPRRDEAQQDLVTARTYYAQARMLLVRNEPQQALRHFQRAYRYAPELVDVMEDIVSLAVMLSRESEVTRYAVLACEQGKVDTRLGLQIASILSQQGDWERARQLYEQLRTNQANSEATSRSEQLQIEFELGRHCLLLEDYAGSAAAFGRVLQRLADPQTPPPLRRRILRDAGETYLLFAEVYLQNRQFDQAREMVNRATQAGCDEDAQTLQLARISLQSGDPEQAKTGILSYLERQGTQAAPEAYATLEAAERKLELQGAEQRVLQRLEQQLPVQPEFVPLLAYVAKLYLQQERWDDAEALYSKLHAQDAPEGLEGIAQIYRHQRDAARLLGVWTACQRRHQSLAAVSQSVERLGQEAELLRQLEELALGEDADLDTKLAAMTVMHQVGRTETALSLLRQASTESGFSIDWLLRMAVDLSAMGRASDSVELLELARKKARRFEDQADVLYYLVGALFQAERTEEAIKLARRLQALQPDSPVYNSRHAWILALAGRNEQARAEYTRLIERFDPRDDLETRAILRDARMMLSSVCVDLGDLSEAAEWLEQVLDEYPEDVGAFNDLGYLWADQGIHLDRALELLEQAVSAEPSNSAYLDSYGWVLFQRGDFESAKTQLQKAAQLRGDAVILDHLAEAYWKCGNLPQALQAWEQALQAAKGDSRLTAKIQAKLAEHRKD